MASTRKNRPAQRGGRQPAGSFLGGLAEIAAPAAKGVEKTAKTVARKPPKTILKAVVESGKLTPPPTRAPYATPAAQEAARGVSDRASAQQAFRKRYLDTVAKVRSGKMSEAEGGAYLKGLGFPDEKNPFVVNQGLPSRVENVVGTRLLPGLAGIAADPSSAVGRIKFDGLHPRVEPGPLARGAAASGTVAAGISVPVGRAVVAAAAYPSEKLTETATGRIRQPTPVEQQAGIVPTAVVEHAATQAVKYAPKIAVGGLGATAGLLQGDPTAWKGLGTDLFQTMVAAGQLTGLGGATVVHPLAGYQIGTQLVHGTLQQMVDQYGPDVTYGQVLAESKRHPFIYGTNALLALTPTLRLALTALGVTRGTRLIEALSRIKGLRGLKGEPMGVREAWRSTYYPHVPRTLDYQTLGTEKPGTGAWFRTATSKPGEKISVEIPRAKSPVTRWTVQAGYDAISKIVDHLGALRKLPISESKRAAAAMRKQLDRKLRRLPAEVQAAFVEVSQAIRGEDEHYATALATMLQKPNGFTQEEWINAVITDLKNMIANPNAFHLPDREISPAMQRRYNELNGLETKYQAAMIRRRDFAHRSILDEQGRHASSIDELLAKQEAVARERDRIKADSGWRTLDDISPEQIGQLQAEYIQTFGEDALTTPIAMHGEPDFGTWALHQLNQHLDEGAGQDLANELSHLDAEAEVLDTQLGLARQNLDRLSGDQKPIDTLARADLQALLESRRGFQGRRAARVHDAMAISDTVARRWASQVAGRTPEQWYEMHSFTGDPAGLPSGTGLRLFHQAAPEEINLPDAETLHGIAMHGVDTSVFREHDIDGFLSKIGEYLRRGEPYRKWYENSGNAILRYANGDRDLAARIAGMVAVYSASRAPTENINLAVQALRQWQEHGTITVGSAKQAEKAMQAMRGEEWKGLKTNRFYANMLKHIDPARYKNEFPGGEVTQDIWMARLFGLKSEAPTPREYEQMTKIVQNVAAELGWSPEEVQAALWVPAKADAGVGGKGITPLSDHEAGIDFARALDQEGVRFPVETAPGRRIGNQAYWRRYDDLTPKRKLAYHRAKVKALQRFLKDSKLFAAIEGHGVGLYEDAANPATTLAIPTASKGSTLRSATDRAAVNQITSLVSDVWHQDAKAWFRPIFRKGVETSPGRQKGAWLELPRPLTEEEALGLQRTLKQRLARPLNAQELRDAKAKFEKRTGRTPNKAEVAKLKQRRVGGDVALPPGPDGSLYALNFSGASNPRFHQVLQEAIDEILPGTGKSSEVGYHRFDFDGDLVNRSRYGTVHREGTLTGSPDVRDAARRFRAASDEVDRRFLGEPPEGASAVERARGSDAPDVVALNQARRADILGTTAWLASAPGERTIYLAENADFSTFIHELFGHATEEMRSSFPEEFQAVETQVGKPYADWTVDDHEQLARWMERYFISGYAPTPELVPIFDKAKGWMRSIYQGLVRTLGPRLPVQSRQLFDSYFGAAMDENVYRVATAMGAKSEKVGPYTESLRLEGERRGAQLRSIRKGAETRSYNRSLDKMVADLDAITRKMDELHQQGEDLTPEEFDHYTQLAADVLVQQAEIVVRADKREQELRSKLADLEKSLAKGFDNRRFSGALEAMQAIAQDREDILRKAFGDHYDSVFENRRDLLAEWLVSRGLLKQDYEKGTGFYYPMTMEPTWLKRQLKVPAAPLTGDVIGKTREDLLNLHKQNNMILWQRGDWNADPAVLLEAHARAQSYAFMNEVKSLLWSMGRPMTPAERQKFPAGMYILNPEGTAISPELRSQLNNARLGAAEDANKIQDGLASNQQALEAKLADYFRNFAIDPDHLPHDFLGQNHQHLRVIPKGVVNTILRPLQGGATGAGQVWDAATTIARFATIYTNFPGYMIANGANNIVLNLAQMGVKLPVAMARSRRLFTNEKLRHLIFAQTGDLPYQAMTVRGRYWDTAKEAERKYLSAISVVDRYPRAWAWLNAAALRGYTSEDDLFHLLRGESAKAVRDREAVAEEATQHMIDFNRPRDWERQHLTRALFIWPFIRGATAWPFWYGKNYPERVALANMAGQPLVERQKKMLGPVPYWYRDLFPISTSGDRAHVISAGTISPTSVAEQQIQLIHDTIAGLLGKKPDSQTASWIDLFSPVLRDIIQLATSQNPYGTPTSMRDLLQSNVLTNVLPGYRIADAMLHWDSGGKVPRIYQPHFRGGTNDARRLFLRIGPQTASISWLNAQAQTHGDVPTAERIKSKQQTAAKEWKGFGVPEAMPGTFNRAIAMRVTLDDSLKEFARTQGGDPDFLPTKVEGDAWDTKYHPSKFEQAQHAYQVLMQFMPEVMRQAKMPPPEAELVRTGVSARSAHAEIIARGYLDIFSALTSSSLDADARALDLGKRWIAEQAKMDAAAGRKVATSQRVQATQPPKVNVPKRFATAQASFGGR